MDHGFQPHVFSVTTDIRTNDCHTRLLASTDHLARVYETSSTIKEYPQHSGEGSIEPWQQGLVAPQAAVKKRD